MQAFLRLLERPARSAAVALITENGSKSSITVFGSIAGGSGISKRTESPALMAFPASADFSELPELDGIAVSTGAGRPRPRKSSVTGISRYDVGVIRSRCVRETPAFPALALQLRAGVTAAQKARIFSFAGAAVKNSRSQ